MLLVRRCFFRMLARGMKYFYLGKELVIVCDLIDLDNEIDNL